jgi:hypothetical protein
MFPIVRILIAATSGGTLADLRRAATAAPVRDPARD